MKLRGDEGTKPSGIPWVGAIPEHWQLRRAKFLFSLAKRQPRFEDGIVTAFRDGQVTLRANRRTEGFTNAVKETGYQGVRKGDLVIHAMDAFAGAIGVSDSDGKCTPVYSCCVPRSDATSEFYARCVRTMATTGFIESLAKGIRERSTDFRWGTFAEQLLPVPPVEEQLAISAFIKRETARVDGLMAKKTRFIEVLREKRQTLITRAVTKGLDAEGSMKNSRIEPLGEVPIHWSVTKIGFVASKIGSGKTPKGGATAYVDDGVTFLRSQNVYDDGLRLDDVVYISDETHKEMRYSRVLPGDVLVNITGGSIGRSSIVHADLGEANVNQHVCIVRCHDEDMAAWVHWFFFSHTPKDQVQFLQSGAGREGLNFEDVGNFRLTIPPKHEMRTIVVHLDHVCARIDALIEKIQGSIALLREHRTALITAAVTGKIDVDEIA
jgi:type I restriction enzyme S subunit